MRASRLRLESDEMTSPKNAVPPRLFERVRLIKMQPPGFPHSASFDDIMASFAASLKEMGSEVDGVVTGPFIEDGINLVFGADLVLPSYVFPQNTVIVNLEQLGGRDLPNAYVERLGMHPVLDYAQGNIDLLRIRVNPDNAHLFTIGYVDAMSRIVSVQEQDVDVLFYGVVNERRQRILDSLTSAGLKLKILNNVYGAERDTWIARSKLVLNIHYYESKRHEIVRTSFLLANKKAVVSECDDETEIDTDIRDAIAAVPVDRLVDTCRELLENDEKRQALEQLGFDIFKRRSQTESLRHALLSMSRSHPTRINLGSGKAWDPERLNIDVEPRWKPDVLGDIAATAGLKQIFFSKRFGLIRLEPTSIDEITTLDVLEHIPDLTTFMRRCIDMLVIGGVMRIGVPYDLSYGAWQDPTHVRAFNEKSWLYYTEWHWYLGWTDWRFDVADIRYVVSDFGRDLHLSGANIDNIRRTPRAIDAMNVVLRKRHLTADERSKALVYVKGSSR